MGQLVFFPHIPQQDAVVTLLFNEQVLGPTSPTLALICVHDLVSDENTQTQLLFQVLPNY